MEKNNSLLIWLVVIVAILSLVTTFVSLGSKVNEQALADKVTAQVIRDMPKQTATQEIDIDQLAADVASRIVVPGIEVPKFESNEKVNDLWNDLYSENISKLETEAYDVAELELADHHYRLLTKWLEGEIVGFDELDAPVIIHDYEVKVVNLGLDDEDKIATVEFELKVRYFLLEGEDDYFKKTVKATATVTYEFDEDEGEYDDAEVELVFA